MLLVTRIPPVSNNQSLNGAAFDCKIIHVMTESILQIFARLEKEMSHTQNGVRSFHATLAMVV